MQLIIIKSFGIFILIFQESVLRLSHMFELSQKHGNVQTSATQQRNICVVLSCIAEKLAGPGSIAILSVKILDYLISNLVNKVNNILICTGK